MKEPSENRRSVPQLLWKIVRHMPRFLRTPLLRNSIQICNTLPIELAFKKAETESEVQQALQLIHDTYYELGYINEQESKLHFSKFLALPTTSLLIAKWNSIVIASIAVIPDSAFGLPSEPIWTRNNLRKEGRSLVEMSKVCLKKNSPYPLTGGPFLAFCKMVYKHCTEIQKVNTLVTAVGRESQAVYNDLFLFKSVNIAEGPFFFAYLSLDKETYSAFENVYRKQKVSQNIFHYFTKIETANIQLSKNKTFLAPNWKSQKLHRRTRPRIDFKSEAIAFLNGSTKPESCSVLSISENGIQIKLNQNHSQNLVGKPVLISFEYEKEWVTCQATIKWFESQKRLGCMVCEKSHSWNKFVEQAWNESNSNFYKAA